MSKNTPGIYSKDNLNKNATMKQKLADSQRQQLSGRQSEGHHSSSRFLLSSGLIIDKSHEQNLKRMNSSVNHGILLSARGGST